MRWRQTKSAGPVFIWTAVRTIMALTIAAIFISTPTEIIGGPQTFVTSDAVGEASGPVSTASMGARCAGGTFDDTAAFQAALNTGRTVYAPALGGECHITRALVMKTSGQIFHGDGRARTKIVVGTDFTGQGVFVAKTNEPGPIWRDFSIIFIQPDTTNRAKLNQYPPAFMLRQTPRFEIEHVGCYVASTCIDMRGNAGGATIADMQMSAFQVGIEIDGSLDTVRISDLHWYPFGLTSSQRQLFAGLMGCPVGLRVGRMDNIIIRGGLFGGCKGIEFQKTPNGFASGSISDSDFDTYSGLSLDSGVILVSNCHFALGTPSAQAITSTGGILSVSASFFLVAADLQQPVIENSGSVDFTLSNSTALFGGRDATFYLQKGGIGTLDNNSILSDNGASKPLVVFSGGELSLVSNKIISSTKAVAGIFVRSTTSSRPQLYNNIVGPWKVE